MISKSTIRRICLLAMVPGILHAEVYEWFDQQGRPHYSDRRREDAKILNLRPGVSYYQVEKVFDGDTILLANGQKVRLLGINTPEVAGRNKSAEAGGEQAKASLQRYVEGRKVSLQGDVEKQDKYQRTLAHVFTENKEHVNLELVRQGLAAINIYPPNLKYVDALVDAQQQAESSGLGIWSYPEYAPQSYRELSDDNYKGWKRLTGRVLAVKTTAKYSYLQFSDHVAVRIDNQWRELFPDLALYLGKNLEVRGWLHKNRQRFALHVRHPAEIKVLD